MIKYLRSLSREIKFLGRRKKMRFRPVFLVGCGRSGTTILGKTIGKHRAVVFLNERRDLWHAAYPEFDIWSGNDTAARLVARSSDHDPAKSRALIRSLSKEQALNRGRLVLEKLPINCFRLDFLHAVFPEAKYIYLHRNGLEVARSIERFCEQGKWFAKRKKKWELLEELVRARPDIEEKETYTYFEKGLLEWRLSLEHTEAFFSRLSEDRYYSLSYRSLVENPSFQIEHILRFLDLPISGGQLQELAGRIKRRNAPYDRFSEAHFRLAGPRLPLSLQGKLRHSAHNPGICPS